MAEALLPRLDVTLLGRKALHLRAKPSTVRRRGPAVRLAQGHGPLRTRGCT
jgi:hypothetical protein